MLMIPKIKCVVTKVGGVDLYGQELPGDSFKSKCAIVKLNTSSIKTSVRADSSASRGNAREVTHDARLLFSPKINLEIGDKVQINRVDLKVLGIFPRYTIAGALDHLQVDAELWA